MEDIMRKQLIVAMCIAGLTISACSTPAGPNEYGGTLMGAGGGALAGGLLGASFGGSRGALIGAGLGAVAGGFVGKTIGKNMDEKKPQPANNY
jgi:uncharacterized protein YcfJ